MTAWHVMINDDDDYGIDDNDDYNIIISIADLEKRQWSKNALS